MTEVFSIPAKSYLREDGTTDHIGIMSAGPNEHVTADGKVRAHKAIYNRVLVFANSLDEVLEVRSRLPEVFQQFDPVRLTDLLENDWRPEPQRVVYGSFKDFSDNHETLGNYLFLAYSILKKHSGTWIELRDASNTKWGRVCEGWHANPETITSTDVLNGIRKLENQ